LSQRLFELRLKLSLLLEAEEASELKKYAQELISYLVRQTQALNMQSFLVRQHWEIVEKYQDASQWNSLTDLNIKEIFDHIAPLITEIEQDEQAKRFDAIMLDLQLSILKGEKRQLRIIQNVVITAKKLSKKLTIPSVAQRKELIHDLQEKSFWERASIPDLEKVRIELRELMKFLEKRKRPFITPLIKMK
jgi:type I restriction enzyme R subunit